MASFISGENELTIVLKSDVISKIGDSMIGEDIPHEMIKEIEKADLSELFEITLNKG
jgi:hypothetical protein